MTTWVLLRGLMREARHWGEFPAQFKRDLDVQHIATPDLPGNGSLRGQRSASSVAEMVKQYRMQLAHLGHQPPYSLLALSLGAMVAVEWSTRYPEEIERMVLINTSLAPYSPFYHRLRPVNYPGLLRAVCCASIMQREALILRLTSTQQRSAAQRSALLEQWAGYARECPVTRANMLRQLLAAAAYRSVKSRPSVPVLLLAGQQDHLVDVRCTLRLALSWQCPIVLHPNAGHDLPLDNGNWVAQQVHAWLVQETAAATP